MTENEGGFIVPERFAEMVYEAAHYPEIYRERMREYYKKHPVKWLAHKIDRIIYEAKLRMILNRALRQNVVTSRNFSKDS